MQTRLAPNRMPSAERLSALIQLTEAIATERHTDQLFSRLARLLATVVDFDAFYITLYDAETHTMRLRVIEATVPLKLEIGEARPAGQVAGGLVVETQEPFVVSEVDTETRFPIGMELFQRHGMHSFCLAPLSSAHRKLGVLGFASLRPAHYAGPDVEFIQL